MDGFNPLAAANELIGIAASRGGIDHLKLQKELYIAHGIHLAVIGRPLVRGGFKAWQYGPVSPDVYHAAKPHRSWRIASPLSADTLATDRSPLTPDAAYAHKLLEHVWGQYENATSFQLVDLTHRPGTPWHVVTNGGVLISSGHQIPDDLIRAYYKQLLSL